MLTPALIRFRPLCEDDLPDMIRWLQSEAVYTWYGKRPQSAEEIHDKYIPRIEGKTYVKPYLILYEEEPIGYIQMYSIAEASPEYRDGINIPDSAGVDLFIGENAYRHQGLGKHILKEFMKNYIFHGDAFRVCIICPEPANLSAIRAYEKAGFQPFKTIQASDGEELVMRIERDLVIHSEVIRVRANVILIQDNKILLVPFIRHDEPRRWMLPGGGIHYGESIEQAAIREVQEETGLLIECTQRVNLAELIQPHIPWHSITITFLGKIIGGAIKSEKHPEYGDKTPRWFSAPELSTITINDHSLDLINKMMKDRKNGTI